MNRKYLFIALCLISLSIFSCQEKKAINDMNGKADSTTIHFPLPGDSSVYGLACEGCTDSVVVLLPNDCSDPITFDILEAWNNRRLLGLPKVGDRIAVIPCHEDSLRAEAVINIESLYGQWCYMVEPTLTLPEVDGKPMQLPDSVMKRLMVPREYGISLRRQWIAGSLGARAQRTKPGEQLPVQYPKVTFYNKWFLWNGNILLTKGKFDVDKEGNLSLSDGEVDTAQIVYLRRDSLILQFGDRRQSFYRKKNPEENKKK